MWLSRLERGLISLTLGAAAVLKLELLSRHPELTTDHWLARGAVGTIVILEILIAVGLWTRLERACCWAVVGMLVVGNFAYAATVESPTGCACFGRLVLSPLEHLGIAAALFWAASNQLTRAPNS